MKNKVVMNCMSSYQIFMKSIFKDFDISCLKLSINKTQEKVLMIINDNKVANMGEICKLTGLENGSFTTTVDGLILNNLLAREHSKIDRRKINLTLTEEGNAAALKIEKLLDLHITEKLKVLSEEEKKEFIDASMIISKCAKKML